jgi:hypothetical protein
MRDKKKLKSPFLLAKTIATTPTHPGRTNADLFYLDSCRLVIDQNLQIKLANQQVKKFFLQSFFLCFSQNFT